MGWWFEVWTRPGDPNFGRVIDDPVSRVGTIHDGVNLLGDGSMAMPNTFPYFDDILYIDPATPANSVSSLVRLFSEADATTPVFEWLPRSIIPPNNKQDPDVNVSGWGMKSVLQYPRTESFGWDGTADYTCQACDWIWGGANLLQNPGFEDNQVTPKQFQLVITATGGNYTLTDGTDTTSNIAFNASEATVQTRIETDLGLFTDVIVVQVDTSPRTFLIEMVDPPFGVNLGINTGGLTGGTGTTATLVEGGLTPSPWTRAMTVASGAPKNQGNYEQWGTAESQNHTPGGQYSLLVNPGPVGATSNRNLGAQQVVNVTPGQIYQASVWIRPTSGTDRFRLGIFGVGEEIIALSSTSGTTLTANTWNEVTISDITMPDNVDRIIFRIACTNQAPSNPSTFFIDDGSLIEGYAATTVGEIIRVLYEFYTDAAIQGTIYWDDGSGTDTPYLTLDFSDTLDSAGDAWLEQEVSITVYQRMSLYQVLESLADTYDIEFRVVPDDVENGTWELQIYNPAGMQTDYTAAATPAIQGGQADTERSLRRFIPDSYFMVEAADRGLGRAEVAGFVSSLGKIARERIARELPDQAGAIEAAGQDAANAVSDGVVYSYTITLPVTGPTGADVPLDDYVLGDLLNILDPPDVDDAGRLWDVVATFSADQVEWQVQFLPPSEESSP